ncbi:MAG: hypothetical protein H6519_08260 [Microthrixaceae bacterium]|nr:hypothetical protein [Microthrixaceae bacterium]
MAITERNRQNLFTRLDQQLGPEEAETMMELLPHQGWGDVARTGDLQALERSVNDRITAESALLRAELKSGISELRTEFHTSFGAFRDELHRDQRTLQRQIILALVVALVSMVISATSL